MALILFSVALLFLFLLLSKAASNGSEVAYGAANVEIIVLFVGGLVGIAAAFSFSLASSACDTCEAPRAFLSLGHVVQMGTAVAGTAALAASGWMMGSRRFRAASGWIIVAAILWALWTVQVAPYGDRFGI